MRAPCVGSLPTSVMRPAPPPHRSCYRKRKYKTSTFSVGVKAVLASFATLVLLPSLAVFLYRDDLATLLLEGRWGGSGALRRLVDVVEVRVLRLNSDDIEEAPTTARRRGPSRDAALRSRRSLSEDTNGDGVADAFTFFTRTVGHVCLPHAIAGAAALTKSDLQLAVADLFSISDATRIALTDVTQDSNKCPTGADLAISIYNAQTDGDTAADLSAEQISAIFDSPRDFFAQLFELLPVGSRAPATPAPTSTPTVAGSSGAPAAATATAAPSPARRRRAAAAETVDDAAAAAATMSVASLGFEVTWPEGGDGANISEEGGSGSDGGGKGGLGGVPWWAWLVYALVIACCLLPLLACVLRLRQATEIEELEAEVVKKSRPQSGLHKIRGPKWGVTSMDFDQDFHVYNDETMANEYRSSHQEGRETASATPTGGADAAATPLPGGSATAAAVAGDGVDGVAAV
ncbi:unnamed protein product, partial [Phaeothamnion confervicola]